MPALPGAQRLKFYLSSIDVRSNDLAMTIYDAGVCKIIVLPEMLRRRTTDLAIKYTLVHEILRSAQREQSALGYFVLPSWVTEGSAEWVAIDVYRGQPIDDLPWVDWFADSKRLLRREPLMPDHFPRSLGTWFADDSGRVARLSGGRRAAQP